MAESASAAASFLSACAETAGVWECRLGWGDSPVLAWQLGLAALLGLYTMKRRCSKRKWCRSSAHMWQVSQDEMEYNQRMQRLDASVVHVQKCLLEGLIAIRDAGQTACFNRSKTQHLQTAHVQQKAQTWHNQCQCTQYIFTICVRKNEKARAFKRVVMGTVCLRASRLYTYGVSAVQ